VELQLEEDALLKSLSADETKAYRRGTQAYCISRREKRRRRKGGLHISRHTSLIEEASERAGGRERLVRSFHRFVRP